MAEKRRFLKGALRYARYAPKDHTSRANLAKSLSKEDKLLSEVMQEVINDLEERCYHRVGILCLSTKPDDILMWSHYADSHRGVCLAFVGEKGTCPLPKARPVHYQKDLPVCNPMLVTSEEMKRLMMYTKANHWSYEQEWRMASADGPGAKRFPAPLLKEVILGAMISPESETVVRKWLASRFHRVKLRRAILRTDGYGITIVNA